MYDPETNRCAVQLRDRDLGTVVRLWNHDPGDEYVPYWCIELLADGFSAVRHDIALIGTPALAEFVAELADAFEGWQGIRTWCNADGDFRLEARHERGGHVRLGWHITTGWVVVRRGAWTASATVVLEAGEEMRQLAADIAELTGR